MYTSAGVSLDQVIVDGGDLHAGVLQARHHRIEFGIEQHEIAVHDRARAGTAKRRPTAERQAGFDRDAVHADRQIGPRQADTVHVTLHLTGDAERLIDRCRVECGGGRLTGRGQCEADTTHHDENAYDSGRTHVCSSFPGALSA
jgi:hypothetical protein